MFIIVKIFPQPQLSKISAPDLLPDPEVGPHHQHGGGGWGALPGGHVGPGSAACLGNSEKKKEIKSFSILSLKKYFSENGLFLFQVNIVLTSLF